MLFGKIIMEKSFNRATVKSMVMKAWNANSRLSIAEVSMNTFVFMFAKEKIVNG